MKSTDRSRAGTRSGPRQAAEHAGGNAGNTGNGRATDDSPRQQQQGQRISQLRSQDGGPAPAAAAAVSDQGLPEALRAGIESLSGMDMSGVRVHTNSSKPAALQAHAYAQGQDIHLGPGQEQHLPHEAWHLVQQAQGRVRPTVQMHGGVAINDDHRLEQEADVMGARALQMKPKAVAASPRQAAQAQAIGQTRGETAQAVLTDHGVAQLDGKRRRNKARHKAKAQEARRSAAIDRRDQGMPSTHPDPVVAASLDKLDRLQPLKSAARKKRLANYRKAGQPSVVEAGAGEGRFSSAFAVKYGDNYAATDIAPNAGPNGFLSIAKKQGLQSRFSVNANTLGSHFRPGSLDHVVGANPFGEKGVGGASYGLKQENPGATGKAKWRTDPRFLTSAKPLLKPGGSVEMYGRSNVIRDAKLSHLPMGGLRGEEARQVSAKRDKIKAKYRGENANPYMAVSPDELYGLAKQTGYRVKVKRAKQPKNTVQGGNPDTRSGDSERRDTGLKPFNTHFSFTPQEQGYESDEDDPRVEYLSDTESDWED